VICLDFKIVGIAVISESLFWFWLWEFVLALTTTTTTTEFENVRVQQFVRVKDFALASAGQSFKVKIKIKSIKSSNRQSLFWFWFGKICSESSRHQTIKTTRTKVASRHWANPRDSFGVYTLRVQFELAGLWESKIVWLWRRNSWGIWLGRNRQTLSGCQNLVVSRILFWLGLSVSFVRVVVGSQNSNKASLFWFWLLTGQRLLDFGTFEERRLTLAFSWLVSIRWIWVDIWEEKLSRDVNRSDLLGLSSIVPIRLTALSFDSCFAEAWTSHWSHAISTEVSGRDLPSLPHWIWGVTENCQLHLKNWSCFNLF
jgi:hypothetical protein